jgi:hypothetical protein
MSTSKHAHEHEQVSGAPLGSSVGGSVSGLVDGSVVAQFVAPLVAHTCNAIREEHADAYHDSGYSKHEHSKHVHPHAGDGGTATSCVNTMLHSGAEPIFEFVDWVSGQSSDCHDCACLGVTSCQLLDWKIDFDSCLYPETE